MSPSPILSPSNEEVERLLTQPDTEADKAEAIDSDEEKERLLTQPGAEADKAEAIDLTVESEAPNKERLGPSKRKVITITPGSILSKNTMLFYLHLNMKRMLNQKSM